MSLVSRIESLILRLAAEFKAIRRDLGNPTELTTRDNFDSPGWLTSQTRSVLVVRRTW